MNKNLDLMIINYQGKHILIPQYIEERERYIFEVLSTFEQLKYLLNSNNIICSPHLRRELDFMLEKINTMSGRGKELVK